jgi:hypothetical protein
MKQIILVILVALSADVSHAASLSTDPIDLACGRTKRFNVPLGQDDTYTGTATVKYPYDKYHAQDACFDNIKAGIAKLHPFNCGSCRVADACRKKVNTDELDFLKFHADYTCTSATEADGTTSWTCTCTMTNPFFPKVNNAKIDIICTECSEGALNCSKP